MRPSDPRLIFLARQAGVKTPHVYHCWHAISEAPRAFCPESFALFAGLERRHVDRIMAVLADNQLLPVKKARPAVEGRGTRLPIAMELPADWLAFAQDARRWDQGTVEIEFQTFLDYWHAQPGTKGIKLDWFGTWRNWVRRSHTPDGSWSPNSGDWTPDRIEETHRSQIALYRKLGRDTEADEIERSLARRAANA